MTLKALFASVLLALTPLAAAADSLEMYRGYEAPAYLVIDRIGDVEIRDYPAMLVAEVQIRGGFGTAIGRGFRILADYIFGDNATGETIAMTVPVEQMPLADDIWSVRFVLPRDASLDALPGPENAAIRLIESPAERLAVLRFSGIVTSASADRRGRELLAALASAGRAHAGPVRVYYYDDPFTLPWRRRNEVAVRIE
jgi:hypothetical protein